MKRRGLFLIPQKEFAVGMGILVMGACIHFIAAERGYSMRSPATVIVEPSGKQIESVFAGTRPNPTRTSSILARMSREFAK